MRGLRWLPHLISSHLCVPKSQDFLSEIEFTRIKLTKSTSNQSHFSVFLQCPAIYAKMYASVFNGVPSVILYFWSYCSYHI